ncbi:MAG: NF038122 family metalloprotease [Acetobacteraceae bacterium]|nr:NF038122 family metalloprotease [Acetobacteraceae bacterium]
MQIVLTYDPSVAHAPAGFLSGLAAAASYLDALVTNPITVTVSVGWGEAAGEPLPNDDIAAAAPSSGTWLPYATVRSALVAHATSAADAALVASLPLADPYLGGDLYVATPQEKAWGLVPASTTETDGSIGFSSDVAYTFDPADRGVPGAYDFIGAAEHELTHVLGRFSTPGMYTPLDLFRYTAPGVQPASLHQTNYFSIDGGTTDLDPFSPSGDLADWADTVQGDSFGPGQTGIPEQVTPTDTTVMDAIGFDVASTAPALSRSGAYAITAPDDGTPLSLSGTGQVTLSGGGGTVDVMGSADTIFAAPGAPANSIQTDGGSVFFYAADTQGQTADLLSGSGGATLVGAAGNVVIHQDTDTGAGAMMVAGAGTETLFGAASAAIDQYWGSFQGGDDLMFAGSGTDILVGGTGADTMVGGGGTDGFYVISAKAIAAMTGSAAAPGQDVIANAHAGDTLALTGFDSLYGAAGSGAAARFVSAALASGASSVALADGTNIRFLGPTAGLQVASS